MTKDAKQAMATIEIHVLDYSTGYRKETQE